MNKQVSESANETGVRYFFLGNYMEKNESLGNSDS